MGLTVDLNYNGKIYHFSKNLNGIVDQNSELHFNISSSTGRYPTNHSIKFNSMDYTRISDAPVLNNAKDSDTSVSGTGTPGDSVTVYDESGKKLGTTTVKEDGTWSIPVDAGTLKGNEKLQATQKAPGSNRDSEAATSVVFAVNHASFGQETGVSNAQKSHQDKIPDSVKDLPQTSEKHSNSIFMGAILLIGAFGSLVFRMRKDKK